MKTVEIKKEDLISREKIVMAVDRAFDIFPFKDETKNGTHIYWYDRLIMFENGDVRFRTCLRQTFFEDKDEYSFSGIEECLMVLRMKDPNVLIIVPKTAERPWPQGTLHPFFLSAEDIIKG